MIRARTKSPSRAFRYVALQLARIIQGEEYYSPRRVLNLQRWERGVLAPAGPRGIRRACSFPLLLPLRNLSRRVGLELTSITLRRMAINSPHVMFKFLKGRMKVQAPQGNLACDVHASETRPCRAL